MKSKIMVTRASMPPMEEYMEEIKSMWDSHWLTNMGPKHNLLQKELVRYLKTDNVELVVNGHMAIEMTLQAMGLRGEVITTPFTCASTTHAIVRSGLMPVFCDINPDDYTIDPDRLASLLTSKTCAILPVHVYGNICNIEAIDDFAKRHGLKVIYDAAHTFGETYKGRGVACFGDASCFSFHATKVFNSIEGGCVCYRDDEVGERIYDLKDFGIHGPEEVSAIGANAKMNEFCAAMGLCNLRHIEEYISARKKVCVRYDENLEGIKGLKLNRIPKEVKSNYAYYPVVFDKKSFGTDRDQVFEKLYENGIMARKYFYPATNDFTCYKGRFDNNDTPVARYISESVLTLPVYPELELKEVDRICSIIKECVCG